MATRKYTNELYDLMVEGIVDPMWLASSLMSYMSEQAVKDFCETELEDFFEVEEEADDEPDFPLSLEYDEGDY